MDIKMLLKRAGIGLAAFVIIVLVLVWIVLCFLVAKGWCDDRIAPELFDESVNLERASGNWFQPSREVKVEITSGKYFALDNQNGDIHFGEKQESEEYHLGPVSLSAQEWTIWTWSDNKVDIHFALSPGSTVLVEKPQGYINLIYFSADIGGVVICLLGLAALYYACRKEYKLLKGADHK